MQKLKSVKAVAIWEDDDGAEHEITLMDAKRGDGENINITQERSVVRVNRDPKDLYSKDSILTDGQTLVIAYSHLPRKVP